MSRPRTLIPKDPEKLPLKAQPVFRGDEAAEIRALMEPGALQPTEVVRRLVSEALEARRTRRAS